MTRPAVEFTDYQSFPLEDLPGPVKGLAQRIIARDRAGRLVARILEFSPGTDTTPNGVQRHDYFEEIYIISGQVRDLSLGQDFGQGCVASRPPGMPHGPWYSETGCVMYEVHTYLD